MPEAYLNTEITRAFNKLKLLLTQNECKIISEKPPTAIKVIHGSVWGMSPKTAKKEITFELQKDITKTHVVSISHLTRDYLNLTITGYVFSAVLMLICLWIGFDLQSYASNGAGFWGWLAWTNGPYGHFDPSIAAVLIKLSLGLAAFLVGTIAVETIIVVKVQAEIHIFAEEIIRALQG